MSMRKQASILAAAISVGCGAFVVSSAFAQDSTATGGMSPSDRTTASPSTMPSDRSTSVAPDAHDIRALLAKTTENAVSKNSFSNFYGCFVDADRDRIGAGEKNITRADWDRLNGRLESFQKNWKAKYNQEFDIKNDDLVFNDQFRVIQGEIGEAQPAGARMGTDVKTGAGTGTSGNRDPSMPNTTPGPQSDRVAGGDTNREPGRNVAKLTFPASHGLQELYIPLIHEMPDNWKIDAPDTLDARKLYDNLLKHVTMLDEQRDQWPADVNDAYRMASHHVMLAVLDKDANPAKGIIQEGVRGAEKALDR